MNYEIIKEYTANCFEERAKENYKHLALKITEKHHTPNGEFKIIQNECLHNEKKYISHTHTKIYKDEIFLLEYYTNYSNAPYLFIKDKYLLTTIDYQCITIINLQTKEVKTYGDRKRLEMGAGFCPIAFDYDEEDNELIITGCYWGVPEGKMYCEDFDFENPIKSLNEAEVYYDEEF